MTQGKTLNKSPRRINHKATKNKPNIGNDAQTNDAQTKKNFNRETTLERSVENYWGLKPVFLARNLTLSFEVAFS